MDGYCTQRATGHTDDFIDADRCPICGLLWHARWVEERAVWCGNGGVMKSSSLLRQDMREDDRKKLRKTERSEEEKASH